MAGGLGRVVMRSNVNSTIIRQGNFDSRALAGSGRVDVAYDGETWYSTSDLPGDTPNPTYQNIMQVQNYYTDGFIDSCGGVVLAKVLMGQYSRYGVTNNGCDITAVWTKT